MHSFTVRLANGLAPFQLIRVLPVLDDHGAVCGQRHEEVDRVADPDAAKAEIDRLNVADCDAIHDGMFSYELRDAAGARVLFAPTPLPKTCPA